MMQTTHASLNDNREAKGTNLIDDFALLYIFLLSPHLYYTLLYHFFMLIYNSKHSHCFPIIPLVDRYHHVSLSPSSLLPFLSPSHPSLPLSWEVLGGKG